MYNIMYETSRQPRFDARCWMLGKFRNKYTVKSTVKMFLLPATDLPVAVAEGYIQLNVDLASQRTTVANEQMLLV